MGSKFDWESDKILPTRAWESNPCPLKIKHLNFQVRTWLMNRCVLLFVSEPQLCLLTIFVDTRKSLHRVKVTIPLMPSSTNCSIC